MLRSAKVVATVAVVTVAAVFSSVPPARAVAVKVTAAVSPSVLDVGTRASVSGRVTPPTGAGRVVVQVRSGRTWSDRQSAAVSSSGTYRATIKPSRTGRYELRVRTSGGAVSPTVVLTVVLASGRNPGLAINSLVTGRGATYAGPCATATFEDDADEMCTSSATVRGGVRTYALGWTFSEYTDWLQVTRFGSIWAVTRTASMSRYPNRPPW